MVLVLTKEFPFIKLVAYTNSEAGTLNKIFSTQFSCHYIFVQKYIFGSLIAQLAEALSY